MLRIQLVACVGRWVTACGLDGLLFTKIDQTVAFCALALAGSGPLIILILILDRCYVGRHGMTFFCVLRWCYCVGWVDAETEQKPERKDTPAATSSDIV